MTDLSSVDPYAERNLLLALLSHHYPAFISRTNENGWDDDWRWSCYLTLPTGQINFHIHDSQLMLFQHLPVKMEGWDGADKKEVLIRLDTLVRQFGDVTHIPKVDLNWLIEDVRVASRTLGGKSALTALNEMVDRAKEHNKQYETQKEKF